MKQIILILIASFVLTNSYAQDTTSIKKVIQNMFIAMKNSDTVLLRSCFATNAVIQTIQSTARKGQNCIRKRKYIRRGV